MVTETEITEEDGTVIFTGTVSDDGGLGGMTVDMGGAEGTVTINEDGTFSIELSGMEGNGTVTITFTDANGQTTTFDVNY